MKHSAFPFGLFAMSMILGACGTQDSGIPPELVGRWTAYGGLHDGLAFEVRCTSVLLQLAQGFAGFRIARVRVDSIGPEIRYDIDLDLRNGGVDRIRLARPRFRSDVLFMGRTRQPWVRAPHAAVPWDGVGAAACRPRPGTRRAKARRPGGSLVRSGDADRLIRAP